MQVKCPQCGNMFDLSGSDADDIRQQVRTKEFNDEVDSRVRLALSEMDARVSLAVGAAVSAEREKYADEISTLKADRAAAMAELKNSESAAKIASEKAVLETEKRLSDLLADKDAEIKAKSLEVDYYKDLKARMSTKMVGESLEQHCNNEFNRLRATAFRDDYFEKDNDVSSQSGSKGDFVYRAKDSDGTELVSIMFEMKNEMDSTEKKHRNEDFFRELDKDRNEKGCEYAVLVTMLESESELYNQGIVDVSYRYDRMYVIRPQFFIPFITMVRNEALRRTDLVHRLASLSEQNVDIVNLRDAVDSFKDDVTVSFGHFTGKYQEALDDIDRAIRQLEATREAMRLALKHLDTTQNKVDRIEVRKLLKDSPSLKSALS